MSRSQLTKNMYPNGSHLFGLHDGQISDPDKVHNGGWYNLVGEKLGWGDLSPEQILRISQEIEENELFIVLSEHDSFWCYVKEFGDTGEDCETDEARMLWPGIEYVMEKCKLIIRKGMVEAVADWNPTHPYSTEFNCEWINRQQAKEIIKEYVLRYRKDWEFVFRMFGAFG